MRKNLIMLGALLVVVALCSSTTFALDPMGSPVAELNEGQLSIGGEYSLSQMSLQAVNGRYSDVAPEAMSPFYMTDVKIDKYQANIGYGISDNWDAFFRIGMVGGVEGDIEGIIGDPYPGDFDSDGDISIGAGTKVTFFTDTDNNITWGGLAQISWLNVDGSFLLPQYTLIGDHETKIIEVQLAVGPTYDVTDDIRVYGGPFIHLVDGKYITIDDNGEKAIYDLEGKSFFGGYIGAQVDIDNKIALNIDLMHTEDADGISAGVTWKF